MPLTNAERQARYRERGKAARKAVARTKRYRVVLDLANGSRLHVWLHLAPDQEGGLLMAQDVGVTKLTLTKAPL